MSSEHFEIVEHTIPGSYIREYADATRSQEDLLQLHVKQYLPRGQPVALPKDAMTIIAAPALPFPKELYEPLWDELLVKARQHGFTIRSIWSADPANVARSGVINERMLSRGYSWMDHARDLLFMTNHFRAQMPRPLVALGHSYGANQLVNVSYMHPRLFSTMLLLDPAIQLTSTALGPPGKPGLTHLTLYQRDTFQNRKAANDYIDKAYKDCDARVRRLMMEHFIRDLPPHQTTSKAKITFTTPKYQHIFSQNRANFDNFDSDGKPRLNRKTHPDIDPVYSAEQPIYRAELRSTWKRLPELRPATLFLLAESSVMKTQETRAGIQRAGTGIGGNGGLAEGAVEEDFMLQSGHLFPFEAVEATADRLGSYLGYRMERYRNEDLAWQEKWSKAPNETHTTPDARWFKRFKHPKEYRAKTNEASGSSKL